MFDLISKDPALSKTYSLRRSKHEALRLIATAQGHNNASRILDGVLERWLRHEYGRKWATNLAEELSYSDDEEEIA